MVKVAGIVSMVQKMTTKKGDPMLFVTLEDLSDKIEMLVFSDTLRKHQGSFIENKVLIAGGRLSSRNGEAKIICSAVREL